METRISFGFSSDNDPLVAANSVARLAKAALLSSQPALAFLFTTIEYSHPTLLKTISSALPDTPIIGASTMALIHDGAIHKHGVLLAVLNLPNDVFMNCACSKGIKPENSINEGELLGEKLLYGFKGVHRSFSVIFSDGLFSEGAKVFLGLQERLGSSFPLAGAMASDNLTFQKTFVYYNSEALTGAACGALFGGKIHFGLGTKHGWKPLGKPRVITKSAGNIIYEIDSLPAVKIYEDYFAKDASSLKKELKRIFAFYPLGIFLSGEKEYLLRNISSIMPDGSLACQGDIPEGSTVKLMIGTKESCLEAAAEAAREVKQSIGQGKINFALVFDSVSRYTLLGRDASKELSVISKELGEEVPLFGLYTYGEQAPLNALNYLGKSYLHNQSISVLGIGV